MPIIRVLLCCLFLGPVLVGAQAPEQSKPLKRPYHKVDLEKMSSTRWTHVETSGLVVYVRKMQDGDYHVTLAEGDVKVVLEIIPALPLPPPRKGMRIRAWGISRIDRHHSWAEIHPVEGWEEVPK